MRRFLERLKREDKGATAIEYGLIAALLAVGIITSVIAVRGELQNIFGTVSNDVLAVNSSVSQSTGTVGN